MNKIPIPTIEFHITEKCNYRCEYCVQGKGQDDFNYKTGHASNEVIEAFFELITALKEPYDIKFIGGEPLIYPRLFETIEKIVQSPHKISFTTNFSSSLDYLKKLVDISGEKLVNITASLHLTQIKDLDEFIDKAIKFNQYKNQNSKFRVVSVVTEENFETIKYVCKKLNAAKIYFRGQNLKENGIFVKYSEEIEFFMKEMRDKIHLDKINKVNLYGTVCYTGYNFSTFTGTVL